MSKTTFPQVPKFDMAALVALQKANIETLVAAQKILYDLVQTVAKKQAEYIKESFARSEAMFKGFVASLPPDPEDKGSTLDPRTLEQFAMERWVNAEVDRITNDKRMRKACKTKTLFQVGAEVGGDEFRVIKGPALPHIREYLQKKYAGQKLRILNDEFKD